MKTKFKKDLHVGKFAERLVQQKFKDCGIELANSESGDEYKDLHNKEFSIEIKYDVMSSRTGNLAFEFYNPQKLVYTGIAVTKADLWIQVIKSSEQYDILSCSTNKLKDFIRNNKPKRIVHGAGDGNASVVLYSISEVSCLTNLNSVLDLNTWITQELTYVLETQTKSRKQRTDNFFKFLL